MTPREFQARSYLYLMRKRYQRMVDRWWAACIRGGRMSPLALQVMGVDPKTY